MRVNDSREASLTRLLTADDVIVVDSQRAIIIRYRKSRVLKVVVE